MIVFNCRVRYIEGAQEEREGMAENQKLIPIPGTDALKSIFRSKVWGIRENMNIDMGRWSVLLSRDMNLGSYRRMSWLERG